MPWGAVAGGIASAVAGKALSGGGGGGGGSGGSNGPPAYVPKDQAGADQNFLDTKGQYQNQINQQQGVTSPYNQQLLQGQFNNPYNEISQLGAWYGQNDLFHNASWAEQAGQAGYGLANQQVQNANQSNQLYQQGLGNVQGSTNQLYNQANQSNQQYQDLINYQKGQLGDIKGSQSNLYGGGNQVLQTALDPQKDLYNRTAQQLTDQTRAAQYARGIQSSPLGASVEANALGNFNIDWQNQQLARQSQGLQAAQGAYGSAQGLGNSYTGTVAGLQAGQNQQYEGLTTAAQNQYTNYLNNMTQNAGGNVSNVNAANQGAFNILNQGAQSAIQGGQAQLNASQNIYNNQNQALQNYNSNNQGYLQGLNQLQSNDLSYMNYGQGAQNQAFNQGQTQYQNQNQAIGQIAGPIGSAIKNTNWGNVGNTVSGWFGGGSNPNQPPANYNWGSDITTPYTG